MCGFLLWTVACVTDTVLWKTVDTLLKVVYYVHVLVTCRKPNFPSTYWINFTLCLLNLDSLSKTTDAFRWMLYSSFDESPQSFLEKAPNPRNYIQRLTESINSSLQETCPVHQTLHTCFRWTCVVVCPLQAPIIKESFSKTNLSR